jgi:Rrf2 family transcriptional regulator, iron-sulfur cluster assembly transcription factor
MFSASCHYALQAMFYIALHSSEEKNVELSEIAEKQNIPKHFLSKILQQLVKCKLLASMKGPNGGFKLVNSPGEVTLIMIIEAIDGLDIFSQCGLSYETCDDENPCQIHDEYKRIREKVFDLFNKKTLEGLAEDLKNGSEIADIITSGDRDSN